MSQHPLGIEAGDILDALEAVGLRYPWNPVQKLVWHRPDAVFDGLRSGQSVLVHGSRSTATGRVSDVRLGHLSASPNRLVVSRAGDFIPERFALWEAPPPFDGEAPLITEARREGWL